MDQIKRVLLIQTALLGDAVYSARLIEAFQHSLVTVVARTQVAHFYSLFKNVTEIFSFEKNDFFNFLRLTRMIRDTFYDVIISFTSSTRGNLLAFLARGKKKFFTTVVKGNRILLPGFCPILALKAPRFFCLKFNPKIKV
ncbi:MAG: hypothetical protein N2654_03150 [Deltaproteobacteria bacterium]|nr:hypothetical protein [Deltaproteobacteria bacterium]